MELLNFISQPWHWSVSGAMIVLVMFLLIYFGRKFGISSTFQTMCSIAGAGKNHSYFNFDWKERAWGLVFAAGAVIGGVIASTWLASPEPVQLAEATVAHLEDLKIDLPQQMALGSGMMPENLFSWESLVSVRGLIMMVGGGFLIGFGTRYAGGCTSGHAISGLSNLQLPSLYAVIGFFIGGLAMTYFILPWVLCLK